MGSRAHTTAAVYLFGLTLSNEEQGPQIRILIHLDIHAILKDEITFVLVGPFS